MIKKIDSYDKEYISFILKPFKISFDYGKNNAESEFLGYKVDPNKSYYSFFFSVYKKDALLFSFRSNQNEKDITRVYLTYGNYTIIQDIIEAILQNKIINLESYLPYLYKESKIDHFSYDYEKIKNFYMNTNFTDEFKNKCEEYAKIFIDNFILLVEKNIKKERDREIYLKYNNFYSDKTLTLADLGYEYSISRERVRQINNKISKKLKRFKEEIIFLVNASDEEQYLYLIYGIMRFRNYHCLTAILNIILKKDEFKDFESNLQKYIELDNSTCPSKIDLNNNIMLENKTDKTESLWDLKEDQQLIEEFIMEKSIEDMSIIHKRTCEEIKERLAKNKLINCQDTD